MVLPLILVGLAIIALAIMYWYITIPIIIIIYALYKYNISDSDKEEDNQSRRSQSNSYQNYSQSDYSNYDSSSNDYRKKNTKDYSYRNSDRTNRSQAQIKRINEKLEKFKISRTEAQKIFGRRWESKLSKPDQVFHYIVETMQMRIEYSYNNYYTNKYGYLYSKVLEIIKIVMSENYNYTSELEISDETINSAFDTFELTHESTKEQIKTKYRELSLKYHPDKNKTFDTTAKMTEINSAYEIIMGATP